MGSGGPYGARFTLTKTDKDVDEFIAAAVENMLQNSDLPAPEEEESPGTGGLLGA